MRPPQRSSVRGPIFFKNPASTKRSAPADSSALVIAASRSAGSGCVTPLKWRVGTPRSRARSRTPDRLLLLMTRHTSAWTDEPATSIMRSAVVPEPDPRMATRTTGRRTSGSDMQESVPTDVPGWIDYEQFTMGAAPRPGDVGPRPDPLPVHDADGHMVLGTAEVDATYPSHPDLRETAQIYRRSVLAHQRIKARPERAPASRGDVRTQAVAQNAVPANWPPEDSDKVVRHPASRQGVGAQVSGLLP